MLQYGAGQVGVDYIIGNKPHGSVASILMKANGDAGLLRPFQENGGIWLTANAHDPERAEVRFVGNATGDYSLTRDEWIQWDNAILETNKEPLILMDNLRAVSTYRVNGMSKTFLEYQRVTGINAAKFSMDGATRDYNEGQEFDRVKTPILIIHKDFDFNLRELETSRADGTGIDTMLVSECAYQVKLGMEDLVAGTRSFSYGGESVYGYMNFPDRNTKTLTTPTGSNFDTTITQVADMCKKLEDDGYPGPYRLYHSTNWNPWFALDYKAASDKTCFQRLSEIPQIGNRITPSWRLVNGSHYIMILVQESPRVARAVVSMDIKVIQDQSHMGFVKQFKVIGMAQPQLFSTIEGDCGVCHGTD